MNFMIKPDDLIVALAFCLESTSAKLISQHSYNTQGNQNVIMDQLEQNQVAIREDMINMRSHMGQLMKVMQNMAKGQEENRHANERVIVVIPIVNPTGGNGVPVVAQPPSKGVNHNDAHTFHIPI